MKKINLTLLIMLTALFYNAQTPLQWTTDLLDVGSIDANLGTYNNKPLNFFTNNTKKLILDTSGTLRVDRLSGDNYRLLYVDSIGNIGTMANRPTLGSYVPSAPCLKGASAWFEGGNTIGGYGSNEIGTCNARDFILKANGVPLVFLNQTNQWVGIGAGNTNPAAVLDITSGQTADHMLFSGDVNGYVSASSNMNLNYGTGKVFSINENGNARINIVGGKVGLDISPAPTKLTVNAGSGDGIQNQTSSNTTKALSVYNTTSTKETFLVYGDGKTNIGNQSSGTNAAMLNVNVSGSGVYGPVNAFDVFDQLTGKVNFRIKSDGTGYCRELHVKVNSTTFPDFVFDKSYKLMTLDERENFINTKKHLPYILTAREAETNGAPIGEVMTGILQNTEELTLYLIDLNKRVDALAKENEKLKKEVGNFNSKR